MLSEKELEKAKRDTLMFGTGFYSIDANGTARHIPNEDVYIMSNTTVTINYSNGDTRQFEASDNLEDLINKGHMFSVTTMHSDISLAEEKSVSKMYAGNPIAAMGYMMMMHRNAEGLSDDNADKKAILEVLSTCISFLKDEVTSHQSGMVDEGDVETEGRHDCPAINSHCEHYGYQCDRNGEVAIEHCGHPENSKDEEGNCNGFLCPLCTEGGG